MTPPNDNRPTRRGRRTPAALAAALLLATGCGGADGRVPLFPASGSVLVDGRPAVGVQVRLHPLGAIGDIDALKPAGASGQDGSFRLGTYEGDDGAPAGRYTLYWPEAPPDGSNSPDDLLGGRYADPAHSGLEATITEGENRLPPFEVEKAAAPGRPRRPPPRPARPDPDGVG
jgi:hypothetical protein